MCWSRTWATTAFDLYIFYIVFTTTISTIPVLSNGLLRVQGVKETKFHVSILNYGASGIHTDHLEPTTCWARLATKDPGVIINFVGCGVVVRWSPTLHCFIADKRPCHTANDTNTGFSLSEFCLSLCHPTTVQPLFGTRVF